MLLEELKFDSIIKFFAFFLKMPLKLHLSFNNKEYSTCVRESDLLVYGSSLIDAVSAKKLSVFRSIEKTKEVPSLYSFQGFIYDVISIEETLDTVSYISTDLTTDTLKGLFAKVYSTVDNSRVLYMIPIIEENA